MRCNFQYWGLDMDTAPLLSPVISTLYLQIPIVKIRNSFKTRTSSITINQSHNNPDHPNQFMAANSLGLQLPSSSGSTTPRRPITPSPSSLSVPPTTGIVVFSGGSAANNLVDVFESVREANQCTLSYVIPISDNGGSSSEIIRVFGGPGLFLPPCLLAGFHTWQKLRLGSRYRRCEVSTRASYSQRR
jgi:hypothetical protein